MSVTVKTELTIDADTIARLVARASARMPGMGARLMKAADIIERGELEQVTDGGVWIVRSPGSEAWYTVDPTANSCTCPDAASGRPTHGLCKHLLATGMILAARAGEGAAPAPPVTAAELSGRPLPPAA